MELEKLNLYRDTSWNDIKLRFCGHSECLPLHSYGPGTRPYYLMHFVLSGKGRLVVNKTEYLIEEKQIFLNISYPWPIHTMEAYSYLGYKEGDLPETELAAKEIFSLPMYPTLANEEIEYVCEQLQVIMKTLKR